ncbi:MAG: TonB-dependent receptor [Acidobacteria bacterium]|nr:TonB-dependent receptor [Acidobacteriota bacterium]
MFRILLLLAACLPVLAQVDTALIAGTVKDPSGGLIAGAKVRFVRDSTGVEVATASGSSGEYVSPPLRPGAYTVRVEAAGFRTAVSKLTLELSQRAVVDFAMEVGAVTETLNVEAEALLLESESVTVGTLQNEQSLKNLPLNTRNFNQLISLSPGVMPAQTQAGNLAITAARGTTANVVNGVGFRSNNYRVDGVDNSENHNGQGIMLYPPVEAIQEFRLQTSVPSAEFGRGGGTVNVAYKSGGRDFHGSLFEFLRNSALDAKNFFDRATVPIAAFHMNQFGATIGGPVVLPNYNRNRDRTFFFFSWEAERRVKGVSSLSTVPLPAFKNGDFSANTLRIYDPLTATTVNGQIQRTQFPNNVIPTSRFDKTGSSILNLYPDPNLSGQVSNYSSSPNQTVNRDNYDVKVDQNFGSRDQMFFRYSQHYTQQYLPGPLPLPAIGSSDASNNNYPLKQLTAAYTRTLSPVLVNEFRAAATRLNILALQLNYGNNLSDQLGIPGVNSGDDANSSGLTFINLTGFPSLGDSGFRPAIIAQNNFQFNDVVSWTKGKHSLRFGGEFIRRQRNKLQSSALHGILNYGPIYTTNPASPAGTGLSIADLLMGAPSGGNIAYLTGTVGLRRSDYGFFIQDTWKPTQALTVSLGLRYDYFGCYPACEVYNRMSYFRPDLGGPFNVASSQIPWGSGVSPDGNNFGPRVGLAYRLGTRTVIRAGAGLMYSPDPGLTLGDGNPPFSGAVSFANDQGNYAGARRTSQGFDRPTGVVFPTLGAALTGQDALMRMPYADQWNLNIENELPGRILFTAAYVGTSGKKLLLEPNLNQARPGPGAVAARRPFPLYSDVTWNEGANSSSYNSMQLTVEKRLSHGVQLMANYTWAHGLDSGAFVGGRQNFQNLKAERGNSDTDVRQRFVLSGFWLLPFGRGQKFGTTMPRALDLIAGGWQLNSIVSLYTGLPMTPSSAVNTLNGSGGQRPDRTANGNLPSDQRTIQRWFDITAFRTPGQYLFGNSGRDILVGPGTQQVDLAFAKSFVFTESPRRSLEFRAECFNISNTPQFNNPNVSIGSANAGIISSAGSPQTFQRTSRQIQLAMKLYF